MPKIEELRKVIYLDLTHLDGRTVKVMPLWDGKQWHMWTVTEVGVFEVEIVDAIESDYVAKTAAKDTDMFIQFVHLMWQHLSWREICPLIHAISDDFHNMGTSVAKIRHFFDFRATIPANSSIRFVQTELEYLIILARTVFDLLQEVISLVWKNHVLLLDQKAESYRRGHSLPETFSKLVLKEKDRLKTATEIEQEYGFPPSLAEQYAKIAPFFSHLRRARDRVVHGGSGFDIIDTERGFCVSPLATPFSDFIDWRPEHYYNDNLVSVLPWIGETIMRTIGACNDLVATLASVIKFPPEIAPSYTILIRGPHNEALAGLLNVLKGDSPWWG